MAERCPITGTSLYLVLKSNGLLYPKIQLKKFDFSSKTVPANIAKKLSSQRCSKPPFIAFSTSRTNGPRSLSQVKAGTHSPSSTGSHTRAYTAKQGPSLPRPQHGLVPSAKFLLVLHVFIYIHFPVHCEPSTPAEEKNLSKLPSQTLSQTIFHRVFQLLPQTAHVCLHSRKRVHTRLSEKDRTQRPTRRNRGRFGWGVVSLPSERFTRFGNPAWPGIRTANFAAFEPWSRALSKNAESLGTAMRSCVSLFRGVAAPLGCVIFFTSVEIAACMPCAQGLSVCARRGVVSLPSARFTCC